MTGIFRGGEGMKPERTILGEFMLAWLTNTNHIGLRPMLMTWIPALYWKWKLKRLGIKY